MNAPQRDPYLPRWKRLLFYAIALFGIPILTILTVELVGRAVVWANYGVIGKSYGLWQYDEELGAVHASHAYNTNSVTNDYGFRNSEDVIKSRTADSFRVIVYGGSTVFCYNLPTEAAWPIRLEQELRSHRQKPDQVLNGGAILWSIGHEFARARRDLPKLRPDVVIIYSGINEETNAALLALEGVDLKKSIEEGRFGLFTRNLDQSRWLKRNSVIVRYLEYVMAGWIGADKKDELRQPVEPIATTKIAVDPIIAENFKGTLAAFINYIRQSGAKPLYVIAGGLSELGNNATLLEYSRLGATVAHSLGVQVLDANDIVSGYSGDRHVLFAATGIHWSREGSELLAKFIYFNAFAGREPQE